MINKVTKIRHYQYTTQTVLPKFVKQHLKLEDKDKIKWFLDKNGKICVEKAILVKK